MNKRDDHPNLMSDMAWILAGLSLGFAILGLGIHISHAWVHRDENFFQSLEAFGVVLTAFVTATTVGLLVVEVQDAEQKRVDSRIFEHSQMAIEAAKSFRFWTVMSQSGLERTTAKGGDVQIGLTGLEQTLLSRDQLKFVNKLIPRPEIICRQSDIALHIKRIKGIRNDLENNGKKHLGAERYEFFDEMLQFSHVILYADNRQKERDRDVECTQRFLKNCRSSRDTKTEENVLAFIDAGYLISELKNGELIALVPWEAREGSARIKMELGNAPGHFLEQARAMLS